MQCPFRVAAGWKYNERTFQIKFCNEMHLCATNYHFGSLVTSNWLAKHYLKDVIMKPKITLLEMQADVLQRFSVSVSLGKCQRARATAMGIIEGKLEDHYAKVWDYTVAIRLSNPVEPAILRRDATPPTVSECGDQVGGPDIPRSDVTPPPVSESGNQVGGRNVSPLKRTKMMARRGGRTKVSGSRNKTPKKTPNGKKHKSNANEDVSLTCDEDFVDLFTHAPNGKQGMSQETEDVQEQEHDDNEVKVSERLTLLELLMYGYTHADAVAAMKEVYGEVWEQQIEEKEFEEGVEDKEVEEEEVEGIQVEQEEVEGIVVEEEGVEEKEVGARVLPSRRSYGAYNFHWEKKRKPSERIRKLKLRKMVEDVDGGGSSKPPWVLE
ncbi:unnamed protein product [Lactuca saligna]|uniref:Uncharacterized protein n=1 Tax=Lactuca saligna TaxID=75948 RepID=A0AA36E112_LACSI|nr:unnamed protein product [Lactuca saligna]